ncbi:MAG: peptidase C14 caspase catalytic subunit p20, partial [Bacteroidota bacterium]
MIRLIVCLSLLTSISAFAQKGQCIRGNCLDGEGKMRLVEGGTYEGHFRKGRFSDDNGILHYRNGDLYVGGWRNSLQEGKGRYTQKNGLSYFGSFHEGKWHGPGEVTFKNTNRIQAKWAYGEIVGPATFTFANKDQYVGEMTGFQIAGQGTMEYATGDVYTGQWLDNQRHGRGRITFEDGTTLEGQWDRDQFQADWARLGAQGVKTSGEYRFPDGTRFVGLLVNGIPSNRGTVNFTNGNEYHGGFNGRQPEGLGIMYYADGEMHGGIWRNGRLYRRIYQ